MPPQQNIIIFAVRDFSLPTFEENKTEVQWCDSNVRTRKTLGEHRSKIDTFEMGNDGKKGTKIRRIHAALL